MWAPVASIGIWLAFILYWVTRSIPGNRIYELYAGSGIAICLTLLVFDLCGWFPPGERTAALDALSILGVLLCLVTLVLALLCFAALGRRGNPEGFVERTTVLVDSGLFGVVRHPLYLGLALWSIALVLQIQSMPAILLGMAAFCCFWMAGRREDAFNAEKFGKAYREYMTRVPAWNLVKGLRRRSRAADSRAY
jgi:protein-S-isoprenylcysteine O-methyltransferase Ste14